MPYFYNRNKKHVLVVHDLIFLNRSPNNMSLYQKFGYYCRKLLIKYSIRNADGVIAISDFTLSELVEKFGIEIKEKVSYSAIVWMNAGLQERWKRRKERTILIIGGDAPHKNIDFAVSELSRIDEFLTYLFRYWEYRQKFYNLKSKHHNMLMQHRNNLKERELINLYRQTDLVIIPSLEEGSFN